MNKILVIGVAAAVALIAIFMLMSEDDSSMMIEDEAMVESEAAMEQTMDKEEGGVMVGGAMMVQSLDIVENAMNADNVTTLVAAVSAAGLVDTLQGPGPFTVFAPTNAAFAALPAGTVETLLLPENKDDLVNILTYHVVAGAYTSADLKDGMKLTTVQGEEITIGKMNGKITVNGSAMVETADVISSNGVTFVIDSVLLPPTE